MLSRDPGDLATADIELKRGWCTYFTTLYVRALRNRDSPPEGEQKATAAQTRRIVAGLMRDATEHGLAEADFMPVIWAKVTSALKFKASK
eukprot:3833410-Amphidinium_carterae.3